jgi:tetratricopeptide (TPR) repeat protein
VFLRDLGAGGRPHVDGPGGHGPVLHARAELARGHARLDVSIGDVRIEEEGPATDLAALAARAATRARKAIGYAPTEAPPAVSVPKVDERVRESWNRLWSYEEVRARAAAEQAVTLDPTSAPARTALSAALYTIGDIDGSMHEAELAVGLSTAYPPEIQLEARARLAWADGANEVSSALYRKLFTDHPDHVNAGISLLMLGAEDDAAILAALRHQPLAPNVARSLDLREAETGTPGERLVRLELLRPVLERSSAVMVAAVLREDEGDADQALGQYVDAVQAYLDAERMARAGGDGQGTQIALLKLMSARTALGDREGVRAAYAESVALRTEQPTHLAGHLDVRMAASLLCWGELGAASSLIGALPPPARTSDFYVQMRALALRSTLWRLRGEITQAIAVADDATLLLAQHPTRSALVFVYVARAEAALLGGRDDDLDGVLAGPLAGVAPHGVAGHLRALRAWTAGDLDGALAALGDAGEQTAGATQPELVAIHVQDRALAAVILAERGDAAGARAELSRLNDAPPESTWDVASQLAVDLARAALLGLTNHHAAVAALDTLADRATTMGAELYARRARIVRAALLHDLPTLEAAEADARAHGDVADAAFAARRR